jgi:hypothetical protein
VNNLDIKRQLGVGIATLADHLRDYKDPFEPSDTSPAEAVPDIDFQRFVLYAVQSDRNAKSASSTSASRASGNAA